MREQRSLVQRGEGEHGVEVGEASRGDSRRKRDRLGESRRPGIPGAFLFYFFSLHHARAILGIAVKNIRALKACAKKY